MDRHVSNVPLKQKSPPVGKCTCCPTCSIACPPILPWGGGVPSSGVRYTSLGWGVPETGESRNMGLETVVPPGRDMEPETGVSLPDRTLDPSLGNGLET